MPLYIVLSNKYLPLGDMSSVDDDGDDDFMDTCLPKSQGIEGATMVSAAASTITATAEALLDHHRAEHSKLTESMVLLAKALKASTHAFSSAPCEDQDEFQ
ncbi:hypothetical protein F4777DRAFT_580221 [Nemania sp. FL0916]|nr:hypothetical protein F4777DRAFT_580221 [Nemania sp. FL0916]